MATMNSEHGSFSKTAVRLEILLGSLPHRFIHIRTPRQILLLVDRGTMRATYSVSTSRFGIGNRDGSFQTPPGIHRIHSKIGDHASSGRIFRDRIDTGENWKVGKPGSNLILTRILRLEGLEEGVNRGSGIDSFDRYIYLHGTNIENRIGKLMSLGCICMKNNDIIALFDMVREGDVVVID